MSTLETARLQLSPFDEADFDAYFPILSAPAMSRYSDLPRNPNEKKARAFVDWLVKLGRSGRGQAWAIRENDVLVGCIRFNRIDRKAALGIVGYELAESAWGSGRATEALRAVVSHGHDTLGLYRIEAWTVAGNVASEKVLRNAGFRHEGTQRQKMIIARERHDQLLFARLAID